MERIILDTDLAMGAPGSDIDDGFALALAHADAGIALELITTVNGNTDVESATILSAELARRLGITDVPIVKGAAASFTHPEVRRTPAAHVAALAEQLPPPTPGLRRPRDRATRAGQPRRDHRRGDRSADQRGGRTAAGAGRRLGGQGDRDHGGHILQPHAELGHARASSTSGSTRRQPQPSCARVPLNAGSGST